MDELDDNRRQVIIPLGKREKTYDGDVLRKATKDIVIQRESGNFTLLLHAIFWGKELAFTQEDYVPPHERPTVPASEILTANADTRFWIERAEEPNVVYELSLETEKLICELLWQEELEQREKVLKREDAWRTWLDLAGMDIDIQFENVSQYPDDVPFVTGKFQQRGSRLMWDGENGVYDLGFVRDVHTVRVRFRKLADKTLFCVDVRFFYQPTDRPGMQSLEIFFSKRNVTVHREEKLQ